MEQTEYKHSIQQVTAWMNKNDAGAMHDVVLGMLSLPAETDAERKRVWAGIRSILRILPNSPIKNGRLIPVVLLEGQSIVDSLSIRQSEAMANAWDANINHLMTRTNNNDKKIFFESDSEFQDALKLLVKDEVEV